MSTSRSCVLTIRNYGILEAMLEEAVARADPIASLLRLKLSSARVVFGDDIDPRIVTLNSRVVFRINGGPCDERIVVHGAERDIAGMTIPVGIHRGLALLGLAEGQEFMVERTDGTVERLYVEKVAWQPEGARRAASGRAVAEPRPATVTAGPSANVVPLVRSRRRAAGDEAPDPGPSAA